MKKLLCSTALACGLSVAAVGGASAQVSGDVVKIGILTDLSGVYADIAGPGAIVAAKMAIADHGGKVLGKPVELISADHQNKPDIAGAKAREWIDTQGVDLIAEGVTSSIGLALQAVGKEKNRIVINTGAATSRLTGADCSPVGFHWVYDTVALANVAGKAIVANGGDSWFFLTADYAFGHSLEGDVSKVVTAAGGKVVGSVRHPFPAQDFGSFLLQAQGSRAKVVGLANAGADTINAIKQAADFGIVEGGQSIAGLLMFDTDVHSLGLKTTQGLLMTTGWYWDMNDETRAFSGRFEKEIGSNKKPTMVQAGIYSAVRSYLKAVEKAGTDEAGKVADALRSLEVNDVFAKGGKVYANGRMAHDMYLAQVKKPSESKYAWDYLKIVKTVSGAEAFQDPKASGCPLVK